VAVKVITKTNARSFRLCFAMDDNDIEITFSNRMLDRSIEDEGDGKLEYSLHSSLYLVVCFPVCVDT